MTPLARMTRLAAAFLGSNLARAAIAAGLSFALARALGAERFGGWVLCTAWASTLTVVVDLGLGVLLTRDGARPDADTGGLLGGALVLRLALATPLAAALYGAAGYMSANAEAVTGLRAAALLGTAGAAYGCFGALLRSQPAWLPIVLAWETAWLALQLAGTIVIVGAGRAGWIRADIVSLITLAIGVQLAQIATAVVCWRRVFGERGRVRVRSRSAVAQLARRALPFAASGVIANVQTRVGPLMLGYLSTQTELGFFAAASRFASVARLAPQAVFAGALPVLARESGHERESAVRVFQTFDRILLAASIVAASACALFAAPALRIVYGTPFDKAAPALLWVSIGLIPLLSNSGRRVFLYASGREALVMRWTSVALFVQVCAGTLLIPALGGAGAAMSVAAGEAAIWWPLRVAARPTTINAEPAEPAEISWA